MFILHSLRMRSAVRARGGELGMTIRANAGLLGHWDRLLEFEPRAIIFIGEIPVDLFGTECQEGELRRQDADLMVREHDTLGNEKDGPALVPRPALPIP